MFIPQKKYLISLFVLLAVAVTLASTGKRYWRRAISKSSTATTTSKTRSQSPAARTYVRSSALQPKLRWNLKALGDRLESRGKEQMIIQGTLTRPGVTGPASVVLNVEPAGRMTLTTRSGIQNQTIAFDGDQTSSAMADEADRNLVQTLVFDTAESFFIQQMKGAATRCLGYRFRPDENNTTGPFHDIYAMTPVDDLSTDRRGAKLFYFNSDTMLLDRITYQTTAPVEIRFSDWQESEGQKVARRIERLENGVSVMTLIVNRVAFAKSAHPESK